MANLETLSLSPEEEEWARLEAERTGRPLEEIRAELLAKKKAEMEAKLKEKEDELRKQEEERNKREKEL